MAEYIDRETAIKIAESYGLKNGSALGRHSGIADCIAEAISRIPAADVEPVKRGRWLPQILLGTRVWDCSECKTIGSPVWKRCPVCEAKMNGGDEYGKDQSDSG